MVELNLNLFFTILSAAVTAYLGFLVLLHNREGFSNKVFIIHASVGVCWAIVNYLSVIATGPIALFWIRLVLFFAVPHVFLFLIFVKNFPSQKLAIPKPLFVLDVVLMFLMMIATISEGVFSSLSLDVYGRATPVPGILMPIFGPLLLLFFLWSVILVIYRYIKSDGLLKKQWLGIGFGLMLSYTLLIFFVFVRVIIFGDTTYVLYSPLFLLPIFIGAAYAILRHQLFSIKVIAAETLTFFLLMVSFAGLLIATSALAIVLGITVSCLVLIFGFLLVRSVLKEVEQRERLEKLTKDLEAANAELKRLDEFRRQVLSFAAHDMKSPIALMKQMATLIYDGTYKEEQKIKDTSFKIKMTADRAVNMIDNFLDIRKIEEGKLEYNFEKKNIVEFAQNITGDFALLAKQKNIEVAFESQAQDIQSEIDTDKIRQVLQNLLDNSLKYTEAGSIHVSVIEEQTTVLIKIQDTGIGMKKDLLPELFEQFRRAAEIEKKIKGTGLGLYISKQIVLAHHGEIWAESEGEGKGSTFFVRLKKA